MRKEELEYAAQVMMEAAKGAEIEICTNVEKDEWMTVSEPKFNWELSKYRVKKETNTNVFVRSACATCVHSIGSMLPMYRCKKHNELMSNFPISCDDFEEDELDFEYEAVEDVPEDVKCCYNCCYILDYVHANGELHHVVCNRQMKTLCYARDFASKESLKNFLSKECDCDLFISKNTENNYNNNDE